MNKSFALFDSLLEPCFILNADLHVVSCNEMAALLCAMTVRKVQKSNFRDLFEFSEPVDWVDHLRSVNEPTPYKEVHFKTSEGVEGKIQLTCQSFPSTGEPLWIVFVRDVTLEERLQKKYRGELEQKEGYILELQKAKQSLENYSKNLEKMVAERTAEIQKLNTLMAALLDSLGQGFFAFDRAGLCHDFSSKACETVLEGRPNSRPAWEALKVPPSKVDGFKKWLQAVFADMLPFEDLAPLGPPTFPHSEGKQIRVEYFPLRGEAGTEGIVVVASDITSLVQAQHEAETERENAKLILNLINKKQQISRFVRETQGMIKGLTFQMSQPLSTWDLDEIFRALHTIKGGAASFNVSATAQSAHEAENCLSTFRENPGVETSEDLSRKIQEIIQSFENFLRQTTHILGPSAFSEERSLEMPVSELKKICHALPSTSHLRTELLTKYVLEPARTFFEPYGDVIQKVAEAEGKKVEPLQLKGGDLPIYPEAYSTLFSTLVHAFRNAVDHGIETPEAREKCGKSPQGRILVSLSREATNLKIVISDDGHGVDPQRIRDRLNQKGIINSHETDAQVIQHVFDSSFSTREVVSETSGRGVGMDAIRVAAMAIGGRCFIKSDIGKGSQLVIEVPWVEFTSRGTSLAS